MSNPEREQNELAEMRLRDWVTRVLDAWADETEICATPTPAPNLTGWFTVDLGGRYFSAPTRDKARLEAAIAAFKMLPPTERERIGGLKFAEMHINKGGR